MYTFSLIILGSIIALCLIQAAIFITERYRPISSHNKNLAKLKEFASDWYVYPDQTDYCMYHVCFLNPSNQKMYLRYRNHPFIVKDSKSAKEVGFSSDNFDSQQNILLADAITALESLTSAGIIQKRK